MLARFREWLHPPGSARQEIMIEGGTLALKSGYHVKSSVNLMLLPVLIPDCRSYTVEYRVEPAGEFDAFEDKSGHVALRSRFDPLHPFPVCWLPRSFLGKRLDRHLRMIDRKRVSLRAGVGARRAA
ncbi:MAG: hypothetical protein OHK0028_09860 [Deltaproteobacteria bacterium]